MSEKRKYKELALTQKLDVLKDIDQGMSVRKIARKFGISNGTVSNLSKNRDQILARAQSNEAPSSKRASRVRGDAAELDQRVYDWFIAARSRNIPITGPIIQEKARIVSSVLGMEEFKASNGWLESFRTRHNISFRLLSGESAELDHQVVEDWKKNASQLLSNFRLEDVWNFDETGLFWKGLPNRSLVERGSKSKGGKLAKERLTIGLLCSSVGEKFKPIVIGKSAMPRAFERRLPLSVHYRSNKTAWMTSSLFVDYMALFNESMISERRNVALLLDNAPCHPKMEFSNVKLIFLPPNTTAGTQPLDVGIIKNFKVKYRQRLLNHLIMSTVTEQAETLLKRVNLKHSIKWISESWRDVSENSISNCFRAAGISDQLYEDPANDIVNEEKELLEAASALSIDDPVLIEEDVEVCELIGGNPDWENAILDPVPSVDGDTQDEEFSNDESADLLLPTLNEALDALRVITDYAVSCDLDLENTTMSVLQKLLVRKRVKQMRETTLEEFFS
jgi:transcriptional regulator with XRE-family HTH domain